MSEFKQEINRHLDGVEVISFDVFDTLFVRPFVDPEDAFDLVGERLGVANFRELRRRAQTVAFQRMAATQRSEIRLDDIYNCMVGLPSGISCRQASNAELELELAATLPNPELIPLFRELAKAYLVVIVSDMYLPQEFFERLFERHGLPKVPMFVSCEHDATKRDRGELFNRMIAELDIDPERVLHVGDNAVSDVQRGREKGLKTLHYVNSAAIDYEVSGLLGTSIAASMVKLQEHRPSTDSLYSLGFRFGGPAAMGLLEWVRDQAIEDRIDVILFVARDGFVLDKIASSGHVSRLPPHHYFPGSRVSFALATIQEQNFDCWLDFLLSGALGLSPDEVLARVGVCVPEASVMQQLGLGDEVLLGPEEMVRMRRFLSAYRAEFIKVGQQNRRGLFNLLLQMGVRSDMRVAMVDVGWAGTTQETMVNALRGMLDIEIFGYYLALVDSPECRRRREQMSMKGLLESSLVGAEKMSRLYERRVGVELMFSAPHEAIIGYALEPAGQVRVIEDAGRGADPISLRAAVNELQRGMLDFVGVYQGLTEQIGYRAHSVELAHTVIDFSMIATSRLSAFNDLANFDAWGSSRNHRLTMVNYQG